MERKRRRPCLEMNPLSTDPPSATPVARPNLPGSVAAAFNGTYLILIPSPHLVAVRCHASVLSCLIPFLRVCTLYSAPVSICIALPSMVHHGSWPVAWCPPRLLTLNVSHLRLPFSQSQAFLAGPCRASARQYTFNIASALSTDFHLARSGRFHPGHVHWVQHQEAG
jgi:hypothetical protein